MPNPFTADESSFQKPKSRVAALVAYKTVADAAAKLSLFAITVLAARRLTPAAFGTFALGSTVGWIAAVAADFGMQMHLARAVVRSPDHSGALLRAWLRLRALTTAASIAIVAAGVAFTQSSSDVATPIFVLCVCYAANGLVEFLNYFYRGLSRSDIESTLTIAQRAATLVCAFAALIWWPTAAALALAMVIPAISTLLISLRVALRIGTRGAGRPASAGTFQRDVAPIGAGIVLSALYFRIDVFLVQLWAGTESVGLYNAVFRVIEGLRLVPAAVLAVALPALCRARDYGPLVRTSFGVVGFAIATAAVAWPAAPIIVPLLFGEAFRPAIPAFRILVLTFPLLSLNYALTQQLIGWGLQRAFAGICAAALAANLAFNVRLIPALSISGAAWATFATELVVTAGCAIALASSRRAAAHAAIVDQVMA